MEGGLASCSYRAAPELYSTVQSCVVILDMLGSSWRGSSFPPYI